MGTLWEQDSELGDGSAELPAFHCGLHAHMYAIWNVDGAERLGGGDGDFWLLADMHHVHDADLARCLEQAVELSPDPARTAHWLNEVIERLEREQPMSDDDPLGPLIRRDDFTVLKLG